LVAFGEQLLRENLVPEVGLMALEKARALRTQHPRTLLALTAAYRQCGEHEKARSTVMQYTEAHPGDPLGFLHLAQICKVAGDASGERAALERTLEMDPNAQNALVAKFSLSSAEHDPAKEQQLAEFGEQRRSWMAFVLASAIAGARGDAKRAVKWAERASELNPEGEEPLLQHTTALGQARDVAGLARVVKPQVESGRFSKRVDWNYAHVLRHLGLNNDAVRVLRKAASGDVPDDFKASCATAVEAWSGLLTGIGVPLEVHPSGVLLRPVLLTLDDGDGGVVLNAGAPLPAKGGFSWRVANAEAEVSLQQGQTGSVREPHALGVFKVRSIQPGEDRAPTTIDCHVTALPDGALHFLASQNGRRLPVGWTPPRTKLR
jgi:tetratricopeptide (TPR) repeat protein